MLSATLPCRPARRLVLLPPVALLGVLSGLVLIGYVRGSWADASPADPAPGAAPVAQVLNTPERGKEVRASVLLPYPLDEVWDVVTDLEGLGDVCTSVRADRLTHRADGACRLEARARSVLAGEMPFAVEMRQQRGLFEYVCSWDGPGDGLPVNRGRWVLTPRGSRATAVSISMEVEVRGVPTFVIRNLSRGRLCDVLVGLERRLREGPSGKSWLKGP
jgi:hypothetical protein